MQLEKKHSIVQFYLFNYLHGQERGNVFSYHSIYVFLSNSNETKVASVCIQITVGICLLCTLRLGLFRRRFTRSVSHTSSPEKYCSLCTCNVCQERGDYVLSSCLCFACCRHEVNDHHDDVDWKTIGPTESTGKQKESETLGEEIHVILKPLGPVDKEVEVCVRCHSTPSCWTQHDENVDSAVTLMFGSASSSVSSKYFSCQRLMYDCKELYVSSNIISINVRRLNTYRGFEEKRFWYMNLGAEWS